MNAESQADESKLMRRTPTEKLDSSSRWSRDQPYSNSRTTAFAALARASAAGGWLVTCLMPTSPRSHKESG